jgi:signal transduction histidine kinase
MSIIGNLDLILLKGPPLSQDQFSRMTACLSHCGELKNMILSLLEIHKLEEGNLKLDIEKTDIAELIKEVVGQTDFTAKQNQVLLLANGIDTPYLIDFDKNLIRRVLTNLLTNAIRHTPAGGRVEVKTDLLNTQKEIKLRVIDTGYGLAPEYHQRVFNKFEQVRLKRDGVTVGSSGIGLAFCKMAVEAHAGKIWVESEGEGKGATFQFTLPVKQPG